MMLTPLPSSPDGWLRLWAAYLLWTAETISKLQQDADRVRRGEL